jgi:predicted metalloendopeptidase
MLLGASLSGLMSISTVRSQERSRPSGEYGPWGLDLSGADLGTKPGHDFFRYSNGAWFDHAAIAPDHDTNSIDITLLDITEARIHDILISTLKYGACSCPAGRTISLRLEGGN